MKDFSYITSAHPSYIESLYHDFVKNPESVDPEFRRFFEGFDFAVSQGTNGHATTEAAPTVQGITVDAGQLTKEFAVYSLIQAYRAKGHLVADTNPIRKRKDRGANLDLKYFGLSDADLPSKFEAGKFIGFANASLQQILVKLQKIYTGHVGIEYDYILRQERVDWLQKEIEGGFDKIPLLENRKRILQKLNQGVIFEKFLHTKYVGQKRFSLEGGETTIAALDAIINTGADLGVQEVVIGMAHRGRLNVLANTLGKTYEQIFSEFEGTAIPDQTMGSGDVKYHLGFASEVETPSGKKVHLKLAPNPSHLEAVNPVVLGYSRAKADCLYSSEFDSVLPILIHGDASLAGQGIVYEIIQMSDLHGYYTGGTIHFVINNQIGFTTDFDDARSSYYSTSVAATIQAPVLHVNGDDPEAVVKCVEIATRYRQEFNADIFVDMVCYRRHGHNEGDDPKFTQPQLYSMIDKHANPRETYVSYLLQNGEPDAQQLAKDMEKLFWSDLQERLDEVKQNPLPYNYQQPELWWKSLRRATEEDFDQSPFTAITEETFKKLFNGLMTYPQDFKPLRKVDKLLQDKIKLFEAEQKVDWATGELLGYSSLLVENKDVRMSGQDVKRGTFSHRHAVIYDENTNKEYNRLNHFQEGQSKLRIYNSLLSEYAVLGFEYGYAMANPNNLVIWEAQFGDFANGAQIIIDQFIASSEQKWQRMSGVVMLLPHGYEGQGPEHSSARLERFLQLCAELNMVVTNITTSANFFHALRRQMTWSFRKPLINFSPKANLRLPAAYSHMSEFTNGRFKEVIDDTFVQNAGDVKKVLFCSGKVYYDLADRQQKEARKDVAVVRVEQLYPLPYKQLEELYKKYNKATWFWVQEEPLNMGAAAFLQMNLKGMNYGIISRQPGAATASGYSKVHAQEQAEIVETAFTI
ncbi:2-oxoglutarate dehydrogenase E1 component [Flavisolibacter ginsenosidimutans]|uniref:oxoglutarate dehydrogenase (succinyl-transferring) n=1 Tax=Flavisolibacter ginsenosidimutans TaxID=661481 RepID=A0A5B8UGY8_9BACT|nr:2-oxoglutarate dehydrogenase E1 component [Flavisolibacter ginsenosidimutans]QEC55773.1 2-oxoglutarate dehydrogenase E1 component [Flavisolibacter ginsenosidimutans]